MRVQVGIVPWYMRLAHVLPADTAHSLSKLAAVLPGLGLSPGQLADERLSVEVAGIRLSSPIGLAAGYDKEGTLYGGLSKWGMGFYVVGSVTAFPRRPMPRPNLYRPRDQLWALNAYGLPSQGIVRVSRRLRLTQVRVPIFLSLAGFSLDEFSALIRMGSSLPSVSALELNISCPLFDDPAGMGDLAELASRVARKPSFMKLSPRHEALLEEATGIAERARLGIALYNTIPVRSDRLGAGRGGLSGLPLYRRTLEAIARVRSTSREVPVIAIGGFFTGPQVLEAVEAGADAVEALTAVAFRGPMAFRRMSEELLQSMAKRGYRSLEEARSYRERGALEALALRGS